MNKLSVSAGVGCLAIAYALAATPTANAATRAAWSAVGGGACQLSIPTTNTGVRPRATGFRNESTTVSNFVICPIPSGVTPSGGNTFTNLVIFLQSIDGAIRNVTCTAAVGWNSMPPKYSSKTLSVGSSPIGFFWYASDLGGSPGGVIPGSMISSVTCNLPPQVLIEHTEAAYYYDVGA